MQSGHLDDEREQIVNDGVQGFVDEGTPWNVGYGLELPVDKELGRHHDEPYNTMLCM